MWKQKLRYYKWSIFFIKDMILYKINLISNILIIKYLNM